MNLKKLLLPIILATFIPAAATSYANENQNAKTQKSQVVDMVNQLSLTNPKSIVWLWNKSGITEDPLNRLMTYYTLQYDELINILDGLTAGTCSDLNGDLCLIKDMLASDYGTCYDTAKSGKSGINCLAKFHGGLLSTATMLYMILTGKPLEEVITLSRIILGETEEPTTH